MSLLIKGIDMPENCRQCDFTHCTHFGQKLCTLLTEAISIKHKLPNCPLVEIPTPHGNLIDRDDLLAYFDRKAKGKTAEEALKLLYTALKAYPAVIEQENAQ